MKKTVLGVLAVVAAVGLPTIASAATAIATTNVNLRAGPSTAYPAVNVVPSGYDVEVYGCLSDRSWCDVSYGPQRGWMSSNYLAYIDGGRRYTGARVVSYIAAPTVSFSVGRYWDDHYRGRSFYRDRARWERNDGWDRRDAYERRDRRDDWRERQAREERRDRRDDWRERQVREERRDRREDWRAAEERRDRSQAERELFDGAPIRVERYRERPY